jgi:rSAM/selenodomain-associated transferase 1
VNKSFQTQLGVFAKYWEPGQVKTRLAHDTNHEFAARVYRQFIQATLETATGIAQRSVLAFTPTDQYAEFAQCLPAGWTMVAQATGDLGQRMHAYFSDAHAHQIDKVVLIGSDSPHLPATLLEQAFDQLDSHQCVIGPARDGGYYLIGARNLVPPVFEDVDWSTDNVLQQTLTKLQDADISYALLPPWLDIDTIEDFRELQRDLEHSTHWLGGELDTLQQEFLS